MCFFLRVFRMRVSFGGLLCVGLSSDPETSLRCSFCLPLIKKKTQN